MIHFKRVAKEGAPNNVWHFRQASYSKGPASFNLKLVKYYDETYDRVDALPVLSNIEYEKGQKNELSFHFIGNTRCTEFWGARCFVGRLDSGESFRFYLSSSDDFISIDIPSLDDESLEVSLRQVVTPSYSEKPQRKYYDPAYDLFCYASDVHE